jgi:hypothetical protein
MMDITHVFHRRNFHWMASESRHKSELAERPMLGSSRGSGLNGFGDRPEVEEDFVKGPEDS